MFSSVRYLLSCVNGAGFLKSAAIRRHCADVMNLRKVRIYALLQHNFHFYSAWDFNDTEKK